MDYFVEEQDNCSTWVYVLAGCSVYNAYFLFSLKLRLECIVLFKIVVMVQGVITCWCPVRKGNNTHIFGSVVVSTSVSPRCSMIAIGASRGLSNVARLYLCLLFGRMIDCIYVLVLDETLQHAWSSLWFHVCCAIPKARFCLGKEEYSSACMRMYTCVMLWLMLCHDAW